MAEAKRDQNRIPTLLAVSSVDGKTPVTLYADPTTHRLYVDIPGSSGDMTKAVYDPAGYDSQVEVESNKTSVILESSTDTEYPTAKAVFDLSELKATQFTGICTETPLPASAISINYTSRILTVIPPLGYFHYFTDGSGIISKYTITGNVNFPAFTDTSGVWYFYFDNTGTAVTTQTPWADFNIIAPVYRVIWNKTLYSFIVTAANATAGDTYTNNGKTYTVLYTIAGGTTLKMSCPNGDPQASGTLTRVTGTGDATITFSAFSSADKSAGEDYECHPNDISAAEHAWQHKYGSVWYSGQEIFSNVISSGSPNASGLNTCIGLSGGTNFDDNLQYTITNGTGNNLWEQDLGSNTPAFITVSNGGQFPVRIQDAGGLVSNLPTTRFPFSFSSGNLIEFITSTGTRTVPTSGNFVVYYLYAFADPRTGKQIKSVSSGSQYTTFTNAQASTWVDVKNLYPSLNDSEIRPLYKLTYEYRTSYDIAVKKAVLREIVDIRQAQVISTTTISGSLPASSVTVVPAGNIAATNVQTALEELDAEKAVIAQTMYIGTTGVAINRTSAALTLAGITLTTAELGSSTATTQSANDNSTKLATTAYVDALATMWKLMPGTPTRASNTTFTVTGDITSYIAKGMIIKWTESSTVRCAMVSIPSTYGAPNTTITIIGDTMASIDASSLKYCLLGAEMFQKNFALAGNIGATGTDVANAYYATEPMRVIGADLQVGTAGTTNSTTIDINKAGTTMFTTKPTLATTVATSPTPFTADTATSLALGDRVSIDIDAVQTTNAVDLYVQLYVLPTRYLSLS